MKWTAWLTGCAVLAALAMNSVHSRTRGNAAPAAESSSPLPVHYFRIPVCHKCDELEEGILKELRDRHGKSIRIVTHDLSREDDYLLLTRLEREMGVQSNQPAVVIVGRRHLAGEDAIRGGLACAVEEALGLERQERVEGRRGPDPHGLPPNTLRDWMANGKPMRLIGLPCGSAWPDERLLGAAVLRAEEIEVEAKPWDREIPVVLYCCRCTGNLPGACGPAIVSLRSLGFRNVFYLQGHLRGWRALGYDVEPVLSHP